MTNPPLHLAGFRPRLVAFIFDLGIVCIGTWLVAKIFPGLVSVDADVMSLLDDSAESLPLPPAELARWAQSAALIGLLVFIAQTYFILAEWRWGRTLGKAAMGLRVVKIDGAAPGFWAVTVRDSIRWIWDAGPGLIIAAPMMWMRGTRPGDLLAKLRVIQE